MLGPCAMGRAERPLALTLGDPAGIGPDITLLAFAGANARRRFRLSCCSVTQTVLARAPRRSVFPCRSPPSPTRARPPNASPRPSPCFRSRSPARSTAGRPDVAAMPAVKRSIERAVEPGAAQARQRAVVTNPMSKALLYQRRLRLSGHTEYLAALAGGEARRLHPVMMLVAGPVQGGARHHPHSAEGRAARAHHGSDPRHASRSPTADLAPLLRLSSARGLP